MPCPLCLPLLCCSPTCSQDLETCPPGNLFCEGSLWDVINRTGGNVTIDHTIPYDWEGGTIELRYTNTGMNLVSANIPSTSTRLVVGTSLVDVEMVNSEVEYNTVDWLMPQQLITKTKTKSYSGKVRLQVRYLQWDGNGGYYWGPSVYLYPDADNTEKIFDQSFELYERLD
jgi:hypothetical protein